MSGRDGTVARLDQVTQRYRHAVALDAVTLPLPAGRLVGLIGPDGVGKSSLLSIVAGARQIQSGKVYVLGGDMADGTYRAAVCPRIAYMPQGLGKNLYPDLSVHENIEFFGRLFGQSASERRSRIVELLDSTGLAPFSDRPAKKLSGGMRQKLGLCCSLIHDPDLLILDEPTTGVDPLSRRQFWELIDRMRSRRPGMSVLVATAYMEEAERFDWLVAMNAGTVVAAGSPAELKQTTGARTVEDAFIALLPERERAGHARLQIPPRRIVDAEPVIAARGLTCRFGDFTAVDRVSFAIERGEIFGFVGSNGCGKTTTMKMLTGLLPASEGEALLFGRPLDASDLKTRYRVGYMSQSFSLYAELTVRQNLDLHAHLFHLPRRKAKARIAELVERFGLADYLDHRALDLPLGIRQRLSLAVAIVHEPEMLILDEPTSGVDPVARDRFWELLIGLSRNEGVTIFVSTHFMNEAERCDRISLMDSGHVLATDTPAGLIKARGVATLEDAFVSYLEEASGASASGTRQAEHLSEAPQTAPARQSKAASWFSPQRLFAYTIREALELLRDPIRVGFALFGTAFMMLVFGFGISTDVNNLSFAVLDHDQSHESRAYLEELRGSTYFVEKPPLADYADLQRRLQNGDIEAGIEIPPGFGRDIERGRPAWIAAWIDGARPFVAQTIRGYLRGHASTLSGRPDRKDDTAGAAAACRCRDPVQVQPGFRQHLCDGALDHFPAARAVPGDIDGARDRQGKGARLDHQPLCDACYPHRIPARQAAALHRGRDSQFRPDVRDGAVRFSGATQRQFSDPFPRRPDLRHRDDGLWHADFHVHPHSDRRAVWHRHSDLSAGITVFRHVGPGIRALRDRTDHGPRIPDDLFSPDQHRDFH